MPKPLLILFYAFLNALVYALVVTRVLKKPPEHQYLFTATPTPSQQSTTILTKGAAIELMLQYPEVKSFSDKTPHTSIDAIDRNTYWEMHVFEKSGDVHTTFHWYRIDKGTKEITKIQ